MSQSHSTYTILTVLTVDLLATAGDIATTWTSPVLPQLRSNSSDINPLDQPVTLEQESWISSLLTFGAIIGPFLYSFISEKWGRKIGLLTIAIPNFISFITLAFAHNIYLYYFARFLAGLGIGGGYTILPMYIAEIAEDSNRGILSVSLNLFWTFGNLVSYVIGPYLTIFWFNLLAALTPVLFFLLFIIIAPETPYYLLRKNRYGDAEKSLMKLRSRNACDVAKEFLHIQTNLEHDHHANFIDLFRSKSCVKALAISLFLVISQQLSGIKAVLFYTQLIFEATGTGIPSEISSIILGLVLFLSSIGPAFIADRYGRKFFLIISASGMVLTLGAFGIYFYLKDSIHMNVDGIFWLPILSLVLFIATFNFGFSPMPWTISSELFPAGVKPVAAPIISASCWTTSFLITKFFNDLTRTLGIGGTFWLFGGFCLGTLIITCFCVPETKGKSFREIQEMLQGRSKKTQTPSY